VTLEVRSAQKVFALAGSGPIRGDELQRVGALSGVSVICDGEKIAAVGEGTDADVVVDARGCTVVPGFVDPHTHLPFYGWRADEDAARLSGVRYESLHKEEGGIYRSARMLAAAGDKDVIDFVSSLAGSMLRRGTTTFETKSGYGLSLDGELRQLRLARALGDRVPQRIMTTCLAAHAVPKGSSEGEWIGEIAEVLLPKVSSEGLASACDIYVESIAFQLEHAARLTKVAEELGLRMRMHADQLEDSQAASFAARWGLASADHLNHASAAAVEDLAHSDTAAVLLPGATFTLRQAKKPPARGLVDAGAIVALGTDLNPGTSPIHSMPFVIALACRLYGLRPIEALVAATVNAAYVLGIEDEVGRLAPGHRADMVVLDVPEFEHIVYRPDFDPVLAVVCNGVLAYVAPKGKHRVISAGG
jgi:imidazolonepropionase